MARANQITAISPEVYADVALFTELKIAPVLGVKLLRNKLILTNEQSKNTYFVVPSLPQNGNLDVVLQPDYVPIYGERTVLFCVLDIQDSVFHVMETDTFLRTAHAAIQNGGSFGGMTLISIANGINMRINIREAVESKLFARSYKTDGDNAFKQWRMISLAKPEEFVHLHVHSSYSMLDGACTVEGIPKQAKLNGQKAIALTDHGNLFGAYKFCGSCESAGVKPIMGVEAYMVHNVKQPYLDRNGHAVRFEYHQTLLAMNEEGWANICEMMTIANRDNFHYVPRIDLELFSRYHKGIIALSGCFKGMVAFHMMRHDPVVTQEKPFINYNPDASRQVMRWYKDLMGDRYLVEVMKIPGFEKYDQAVGDIIKMADEEGVDIVVTNDAHYEEEADWEIQAVLSRISKENDSSSQSVIHPHWIKPRALMEDPRFRDEFFTNTVKVADRCTLRFPRQSDKDFKYLFPAYPYSQDRDWEAYQRAKAS